MKIISWNCNMAFRKKWSLILALKPDILIIQECEHESKYKQEQLIPGYNEFIWVGDNVNKGIGIITFNNYHVQIADDYSEKYKYIIPVRVTGDNDFNLFAIWAMPDKKKSNSYIGQIWKALDYYKKKLSSPSLLIGDWNSNAIWDVERKNGNHSQTVSLLDEYDITSVYHTLKEENHGEEIDPTLYLLKKLNKTYHLDYCFTSKDMIQRNTTIEIGLFDDWIKVSDHMPIIIENIGI